MQLVALLTGTEHLIKVSLLFLFLVQVFFELVEIGVRSAFARQFVIRLDDVLDQVLLSMGQSRSELTLSLSLEVLQKVGLLYLIVIYRIQKLVPDMMSLNYLLFEQTYFSQDLFCRWIVVSGFIFFNLLLFTPDDVVTASESTD
jgi:hypothetical protein